MRTTRRAFIKDSLVAAAGISAASVIPGIGAAGPAGRSANDKIRIGLIGCKNMGWGDLQDLLKHPEVECAALCDVDGSILNGRAADYAKLRANKPMLCGDFRKVLELKDVDAVIIGTPDHWHCLQTVAACQAGKDVYVEKPLANSIAECDIMMKTARKHDRVVQVGQQQRSGMHWKEMIAFIRSGKLGRIRMVKHWANFNYGAGRPAVPDEPVPAGVDFDMWLGPAPQRTFNRNRFHGLWRLFWDYGGGLQTDWGVHLLDMGLWAMEVRGGPKSVSSSGGIFAFRENALETADTQAVLYEFGDFMMTWEHHAGIQSGPYGRNYGVAFIGSNGTLVADRDNWEVLAEGDDGKTRMEAVEKRKTDNLDRENHMADFIDCLRTRRRPAADIEIGRNAALMAHLGNISYRTGRKIKWDDASSRVMDDPGADALVRPAYRTPWIFPEV
jgi:predicted dehydrogenase